MDLENIQRAGILIAREACALNTDFKNQLFTIDKKKFLATNSCIYAKMIELLKL